MNTRYKQLRNVIGDFQEKLTNAKEAQLNFTVANEMKKN